MLDRGRAAQAAALAVVLATGACGGDDDTVRDAAIDDPDSGTTLVVGTFNAGLARGLLDYAVERAPEVAQAVAAVDLDLLCVQEFWTQADWDALSEVSPLAHTERPAPEPGEAGQSETCRSDELDPLEGCVREHCDVPPGQLVSCALFMCRTEVEAVSQACFGCISGAVGDTSIDEVVGLCGPGGPGVVTPFAYQGSYGIGLLSGESLSGKDFLMLDSSVTRRGAVYARIDDGRPDPIHIFCTHLTADQPGIPYPGQSDSWGAENAEQIEAMLAWVADKTEGNGRVLLLGDLNTGPELDATEPELLASYSQLRNAGFRNPYAEQSDARCSYCPDNPLQGVDSSGHPVLIDHVLVKGWPEAEAKGDQFLRGALTLRIQRQEIETAYSDHYGVRLTLTY